MRAVQKDSERGNKDTFSSGRKRMCALFCHTFRSRAAMRTAGDSSQSAAKCFTLKDRKPQLEARPANLTVACQNQSFIRDPAYTS